MSDSLNYVLFIISQVFLSLNVRVNKDWRKKEDQLKAFGYLP